MYKQLRNGEFSKNIILIQNTTATIHQPQMSITN